MSCWTKALPPTTTSAPRPSARKVATKRSRSSVRHRSKPGAGHGDQQAPARAVALGERPGELDRHVGVGDRRDARRAASGRGRPRARRRVIDASVCLVSSLRMSASSAQLVVLIGAAPDRPASRRARTGGRRRGFAAIGRADAARRPRGRARASAARCTVPPEMPRPNARSMLSFQRRVSFISGPVERRFLKSRLERAAGHVPARADARPDQRHQRGHERSPAAGAAPAAPDRCRAAPASARLPARAPPAPPARPASTRKVAAQQNRIPTPPMSPKWRKPRKSVASSDAYETDAVSAAASVPPRLPWTAAPSAATGSSRLLRRSSK